LKNDFAMPENDFNRIAMREGDFNRIAMPENDFNRIAMREGDFNRSRRVRAISIARAEWSGHRDRLYQVES
jgi:hypothetical protein